MNEEIKKEIIELKSVLNQILSIYKLTNADKIESAKNEVLGTGSRRRAYDLCDGKKGVGEIAKILKLTQPSATHHLAKLAESNFITSETRQGKKYFFKLI